MADTSAAERAEMRARAEAATPGKWVPWCAWNTGVKLASQDADGLILAPTTFAAVHRVEFQACAAHIAGMHPAATLALLADLDAAEGSQQRTMAELRDWRDVRYRDLAAEVVQLRAREARVREVVRQSRWVAERVGDMGALNVGRAILAALDADAAASNARQWAVGDTVQMQSGPIWRRDRDEVPQWVGPFGDHTSDREMSRVATPVASGNQSAQCTCDPWDRPQLTPKCPAHADAAAGGEQA